MSELDAQLEISLRLEFIDSREFESVENMVINVEKLLSGLIKSFH